MLACAASESRRTLLHDALSCIVRGMRKISRFSLGLLLAALAFAVPSAWAPAAAAQETANPVAAPAAIQAVPADPRALYETLNELKLDGTRVYAVHDLTLRRDAVHFAFE